MATSINRADYAAMFGPTVGDKIRLADTDLIIEVERDLTAERANGANGMSYGEEVKFGGGKVIRDGMGQSQVTRAQGAVDTVITNALIVDHSGIYKADVGLRSGRIHKIGKAGNPDTQPGVDIIVGPGTEVIAGEGRIFRFDHNVGRRHRPGTWNIGDNLHPWTMAYWTHVASGRCLSHEPCLCRQGQRQPAGCIGRNGRGRGLCA